MSTQFTSEPVRKQNATVYTVMLILSTVFMLIALIAMVIELRRYAPDYHNTAAARPAASAQSVEALVAEFQRFG